MNLTNYEEYEWYKKTGERSLKDYNEAIEKVKKHLTQLIDRREEYKKNYEQQLKLRERYYKRN